MFTFIAGYSVIYVLLAFFVCCALNRDQKLSGY